MSCPDDLKYTRDHEWVKLEGSAAVFGITHFAQAELGDLVFIDLPQVGKTVKQKETFCTVESTKAASDVYAPIGGTVREVNTALSQTPELINKDPYGKGWIARMDSVSETDARELLSAAQYRELIGEK